MIRARQATLLVLLACFAVGAKTTKESTYLPQFSHLDVREWINASPLKVEDLAGKVLIGAHTPEFAHERERDDVERRVEYFSITHPVMMDNEFSYWNALGTRAWPSFYVVDRGGRIRGSFAGDAGAKRMEALIEALLAERPQK